MGRLTHPDAAPSEINENCRTKRQTMIQYVPVKRFPFALLIAVAALIAGCTSAGDAAPPGPNSPIASPDSRTGELTPYAGTVWVIGDSITVGAREQHSSA
jgi:hypothetical protein